jgi:hypothetical protein
VAGFSAGHHELSEQSMSTGTINKTWSRQTNSGEGGEFELPAGGTYPAVLVGLIDIGTHERIYNGKASEQQKVLFVWELTGENDSHGESFKVMKDFTFSLNSKATLRGFLEGWLGRKFGDGEDIDITSFVNQPCVLNVTEGVSGGGKKFVDVAAATKPMKGLVVPPKTVELFVYSVCEEVSQNVPPMIPDWVPFLYGRKVVDDIQKSKEWIALPPF